MDTLEGYDRGTLSRHDLKTLLRRGELTGDIINGVGRRTPDGAPHVPFLDSTFLTKVAPTHGEGSACRRQLWTGMIGGGADSHIGTALETAIAPHFVPGHW